MDGGINPYVYVGNNPGNWVDPSGLFLLQTYYAYADKINSVGQYILEAITLGPSNELGIILEIGAENINMGVVKSIEASGIYFFNLTDYLLKQFPHDAINLTDDIMSAIKNAVIQEWGIDQPYKFEPSELYWTAPNKCK